MTNALLRYGVKFATQPVIRVDIDGTAENLTLATSASETYYMLGDGSSVDLVELLRVALETHSASPTFTATLTAAWSVETEITAGGAAHALLWANAATTLDPLLFGFAAINTFSSATVTSPNRAGGLLFFNRPLADDSRDRQPVLRASAKALSGARRTSYFGLGKKQRKFRLEYMDQDRVLDEYRSATQPYSTLEHAWTTSIALGYSFRLYPDEDGSTFSAYRYDRDEAEDPFRRNGRYFVLWDSDLEAVAV